MLSQNYYQAVSSWFKIGRMVALEFIYTGHFANLNAHTVTSTATFLRKLTNKLGSKLIYVALMMQHTEYPHVYLTLYSLEEELQVL